MDRRWEEFATKFTDGETLFTNLLTIPDNDFNIHVSIRAKNEAHIFLCDGNYPPKSNCYWIILAGWHGSQSVIRKCSYSIPNSKGIYPKGPCAAFQDNVQHGPLDQILNESEWVHLIVKSIGSTISIQEISSVAPLLSFTDEKDVITKRYMSVRTTSTPGYWKLHDYEFLYTTKELESYLGPEIYVDQAELCISMFITMCKNCILSVMLTYKANSEFHTFDITNLTSEREGEWKEERILSTFPRSPANVRLYFKTMCSNCSKEELFWAIDKFEICSKEEIRILRTDAEKDKVFCQLLKYPKWNLRQRDLQTNLFDPSLQSHCSFGNFGHNCISCSQVLGTDRIDCDNSVICQLNSNAQTICSCALGYTELDCQSKCNKGWYGHHCKQKCGFCEYPPCDFITGLCKYEKCTSDYVKPYCNITLLPVLRYPPTIINVGHTDCTIQLQNKEYTGQEAPQFYRLEYRQHMSLPQTPWTAYQTFEWGYEMPIQIKGLDVVSTYQIRAILVASVEQGKNSYEKESVPFTNVTTSCEFITHSDIAIVCTNTSATLTFTKRNPESCRFEDYRLSLGRKIIPSSSTGYFIINDLNPYTYYSLTVRNTYVMKQLELNFLTEEGTPGKVRNVKTQSEGANKVSVQWQPPDVTNGQIRSYKIHCEHINYLACSKEKIRNFHFTKNLEVQSSSTSVVIEELLPYSEYAIKITAYTKFSGEEITAYEVTKATDKPDIAEIPNISSTKPEHFTSLITLQEANCTLLKGLLQYYSYSRCTNPWCSETFNNETFSKPLLQLTNLMPYSDYLTIIKVQRVNGYMPDEDALTTTFKTQSWVPHVVKNMAVYSKTETSLYLKIEKPYPPTGKLSSIYRAIYCYSRRVLSDYCWQDDFLSTPCKQWANLDCIVIKNLYPNYDYTISLRAQNVDTPFNDPSVPIWATTVQEASDPPEGIMAVWDTYHNLTITWMHPNITNGPLTKFLIQIYSETISCFDGSLPITEEEFKIIYSHTVQLFNCHSSILSIEVSAFNIIRGKPAKLINVVSPPPIPLLSIKPTVMATQNTSVTLLLPQARNLVQESFLYIIVSKEALEIHHNEIPTDSDRLWVADILNSDRLKKFQGTFVIGNDATTTLGSRMLHNRALEADTNYVVTFLLVNRYGNFKRSSSYNLQITTTGMKSKPEEITSSDPAMYTLLLLLIIPFALCLFLTRTRKGLEMSTSWFSKFRRHTDNAEECDSDQDITPESSATDTHEPTKALSDNKSPENKISGETKNNSISNSTNEDNADT